MTFAKSFLFLALIFVLTGVAAAQVPAQTAPAKVGIINSDLFANPTGGVTRLVNALNTINTEFKGKRDEIAQLVARFESLQADAIKAPTEAKQDQLQTLQIDIQRKQEDARVAYAKRLAALTDPIRRSVFTALEAYAKQRGIDVLLDLSKFPDGVLLANQNADMTAGFIKDFNSKNP